MPGVSGSDLFWKTLVVLLFIVLLLFALAIMGQKFLLGKSFGKSHLKMLGGLTIGQREQIVLIEAGEDLLVVGVVPGQIRTLHRMKKSSVPGLIQEENEQDSGLHPHFASVPFARTLANAVRHFKARHEKT